MLPFQFVLYLNDILIAPFLTCEINSFCASLYKLMGMNISTVYKIARPLQTAGRVAEYGADCCVLGHRAHNAGCVRESEPVPKHESVRRRKNKGQMNTYMYPPWIMSSVTNFDLVMIQFLYQNNANIF